MSFFEGEDLGDRLVAALEDFLLDRLGTLFKRDNFKGDGVSDLVNGGGSECCLPVGEDGAEFEGQVVLADCFYKISFSWINFSLFSLNGSNLLRHSCISGRGSPLTLILDTGLLVYLAVEESGD